VSHDLLDSDVVVDITDGQLRRERRRASLTRCAKFGLVSGGSIATTQVLLMVLNAGGLSPTMANAVAVSALVLPTYAASRAWVWQGQRPETRVRQGAAFWLLAVTGLVVTTALVALVVPADAHLLTANVVSVAGFGAVWVVKYLILERLVFDT
jgi:putative flippase GtrA